jgi:capsular polysaccharide biosynthesis protein
MKQGCAMSLAVEPRRKAPVRKQAIRPSKLFTFPTRLAAAWRADILEINLPAYSIDRPEVEIAVRQDSTASLNIPVRNPFKRMKRRFAEAVRLSNDYCFDGRFDTDGNIAHILTNVAPILLLAKETYGKVTVILRGNASNLAKKAYPLLGFPILCTDNHVYAKLVIAEKGDHGIYEPHYRSLFGEVAFDGYRSDTPARVFVSRKGTRTLVNEQEVDQFLRARAFTKYYFEEISLSQQWSVMRNAQVVVGIHGAALAALLFNRNKLKLVELFHPGYVVDMYRHQANVIGGSWCGVTGEMPANLIKELDGKGNARRFALEPTRIDVAALERALSHLGCQ